jgi:hypothetical protein
MKAITKYILLFFAILSCNTLVSQNEVDALRYSRLIHGGTARYMAMGGAFSALGADFSALSTNPAAIGVYRSSEMMFTPSLSYTNTESEYLGKMRDDFKYNFNFTNFGMVFAGELGSKESTNPEWKAVQFGFGVNRLQNFNSRSLSEGFNPSGTILDVYHQAAQGIPYSQLSPFDTELAFNTYLLDTANTVNNYVQAHYGGVTQRKSTTTSGGINEMVMTFGGNFDDKLYIGATLGFPFLRYEEFSKYHEADDLDSLPNFKSLTISDELSTWGAGFNFKMGIIYRPVDWVRISGAFHTPTFYTLTDEWERRMESNLDEFGRYEDKSPRGRFDYRLSTPMRLIGGIGFVIGTHGSVSAEYEFVDYTTARLRERNIEGSFFNANEAIRDNYTTAGNLRLGTEWLFMPFSVRAGYAMYGTPFRSGLNDAAEQFISGGIGIREKNFYIDLTYVHSLRNEDTYLYPGVLSAVNHNINRNLFVTTLGFKF